MRDAFPNLSALRVTSVPPKDPLPHDLPMKLPSCWGRAICAAQMVALLAAAVGLRAWKLDSLPGINGDEGWYGVQAMRVVAGEPVVWHTPTGNFVNPLFFGPLVLLHLWLPPGFGLLRVVPLVSGVAALVVNYLLCSRTFDKRTALISTAILAVLPVNIAYSRFAWDASQSLLVTLFVVYLPLLAVNDPRRSIVPSLVALAAAVIVHPTNLFAAPCVVVALAWRGRARLRGWLDKFQARWTSLAKWTFFWALIAITSVCGLVVPDIGRRLVDPAQAGIFIRRWIELLSGSTVYSFIAGVNPSDRVDWSSAWHHPLLLDGVTAAVVLVSLWGLYRLLRQCRPALDVCVAVGWLTSTAGFYVVAGPGALTPHFERYGICLVAPAVVVISRGLAWWLRQPGWRRTAVITVGPVLCWLTLCSFYVNYFGVIERTGGLSHRTFRTANVEPKLQALQYVLEGRPPGEPVVIFTQQWWNRWPLEYLAMGQTDVTVKSWAELTPNARSRFDGQTWFVEFADSVEDQQVVDSLLAAGIVAERHVIFDYNRHALLTLTRPTTQILQNH